MNPAAPASEAPGRLALSVVVPTCRPDTALVAEVFRAIARAAERAPGAEVIVVENGSDTISTELLGQLPGARLLRRREANLAMARCAGIEEARGDLIVFVDDDNILLPDYLARARQALEQHPEVGVAAGRIEGRFPAPVRGARRVALPFLAVRDLGGEAIMTSGPQCDPRDPVGAGIVVRRRVAEAFVQFVRAGGSRLGRSSGGLSAADDAALCLLADDLGFKRAYFPDLRLTHVVPAQRLEPSYLRRLVRGIGASAADLQMLRGGHTTLRSISNAGVTLRFLRDFARHGMGAVYSIQWTIGYKSRADTHLTPDCSDRS
ncbi:glycosyltransferase [Salinarimonas sp.]|uniref:glycosyltransferase n=1 Tax=Salinarimonas sp. TaxID=2766526 RepID=UPI0032D92A62